MAIRKPLLLAGTILAAGLAPGLTGPAFAQTGASPYTSAQRFDAVGRVTGTISADPDGTGPLPFRATRNTYDAAGRLTKVERGTLSAWQSESVAPQNWSGFSAIEVTDIARDAMGRKLKETLSGAGGPIQAATHYSYDNAGRLECTAVRMNPAAFSSLPASACTLGAEGSFGPDRITKNSYDAAGQLIKVTEAEGTPVQADEVTNSYTLNGKLQTLTDGENNRTTYEYDGHDRLAKLRFPVPTKGAQESSTTDYEQYGYDANSQRTSLRNRAGEMLYFSYDALNRMSFKNRPGSELDVTYAYDNLGRMNSASVSGHAVSFSYDALGRKLNESSLGVTATSVYDKGGRRTKLTYPDGSVLEYRYLDTGEMTQVRAGGAALVTFGYDDLGRRVSIGRINGTSTSYAYDAVSRLSQLAHDFAGTTHDLTLDFSYNPASQIVSNTRSNDLYAWTGHGSGSTESPANGLNQLASHGGTSIGHDAKGNTLNDPTIGYSYGYSSENLLTSVVVGGNTGTLNYDPLMRLHDAGTVGRTRFVYDGENRIKEHYSDGRTIYTHVHGPGVDEPLVEYSLAPNDVSIRRFLHADERGSIIAASDNAGVVAGVNKYDEYGKPDPNNITRYQYTGHPYETLTELYDTGARMYNPRVGPRFMQVDPIRDGMNWYIYAEGDPVNAIDPDGRRCLSLAANTTFCQNAQLYANLDRSYNGRTTFFAAASIVSEAINYVTYPASGVSDRSVSYLKAISRGLSEANFAQRDRLVRPGSTQLENDRRFVRFEQAQVQKSLERLQTSDASGYRALISQVNSGLNGVLASSGSAQGSLYAGAIMAAREAVGGTLDFSKEAHRVAIGDALTDALRESPGASCTELGGSRISRC